MSLQLNHLFSFRIRNLYRRPARHLSSRVWMLAVCLVFNTLAYAQPVNTNYYSISVTNEKLSVVIRRLSDQTGLSFSYDARDAAFEQAITYQATHKPVQEILDDILLETNQTFKQLDKQIVIYQIGTSYARITNIPLPESTVVVLPAQLTEKRNEAPPYTMVVDTLIRIDTIFHTDTIVRIDTIRIMDTVVIIQEDTLTVRPVIDTSRVKNSRIKGWAGEISFASLLTDFSLVEEKQAYSFRNFSMGLELVRVARRLNYTLGLRYTQFNDRFMKQEIQTSGGFFLKDTVDQYYTVSQTDTSWFYVTDSSWVPLETSVHAYEITNKLGYVEVNAAIAYDFYSRKNTSLFIKLGGQMGFLSYREGLSLLKNGDPSGTRFGDLKFVSTTYALQLGIGLRSKLTEKLDVHGECYYLQYFNNVLLDHPLNNSINALGIKLGLRYYF